MFLENATDNKMCGFKMYFLRDKVATWAHKYWYTNIQSDTSTQTQTHTHTHSHTPAISTPHTRIFWHFHCWSLLVIRKSPYFLQVMKVLIISMTFDIATIVISVHILPFKVPKYSKLFRYLIIAVEFVNCSESAGGCSDAATKVNRAHEFVMSSAPRGLW